MIYRVLCTVVAVILFNTLAWCDVVKLPENTEVYVKTIETLNLKQHSEGDVIPLIVAQDVVGLDGKTVFIKAGTQAYGIVSSNSTPTGVVGSTSSTGDYSARIVNYNNLALVAHHVKTITGENVPLTGKITSSDKGAAWGWKAAVGVFGLLALPGLIASKNANKAHINTGATITCFTGKDMFFDPTTVNVDENNSLK